MAHPEQSIVNQGWAKKGNDLFNQPYDRTDEIFAKPIDKMNRQMFVTFLAQELKFPRKWIYGVAAKRKGGFDITVSERNVLEPVYDRLKRSKKMLVVKKYENDVVEVRVEEVPPKFPDLPIRNILQQYGELLAKTIFQKGKYGIFTAIRVYKIKAEHLEKCPIPQFIRARGMSFAVKYDGQPVLCYRCREYGHLQNSCPRTDLTFDNANSDTENYTSNDETKDDIDAIKLDNDVVDTLTAVTEIAANYVTASENCTLHMNAQSSALSVSPQIVDTRQDESQACSTPNAIKSISAVEADNNSNMTTDIRDSQIRSGKELFKIKQKQKRRRYSPKGNSCSKSLKFDLQKTTNCVKCNRIVTIENQFDFDFYDCFDCNLCMLKLYVTKKIVQDGMSCHLTTLARSIVLNVVSKNGYVNVLKYIVCMRKF